MDARLASYILIELLTNKISGNPNLGGVFRGFFGVGGI